MSNDEPRDGERLRWGVEWVWRSDISRWWHSSGATMTREQAAERATEQDPAPSPLAAPVEGSWTR